MLSISYLSLKQCSVFASPNRKDAGTGSLVNTHGYLNIMQANRCKIKYSPSRGAKKVSYKHLTIWAELLIREGEFSFCDKLIWRNVDAYLWCSGSVGLICGLQNLVCQYNNCNFGEN